MSSCARSPAPSRVADVEIRLVARNNEVLATKTDRAAGHVAFDPGLARGEGGSRRASSSPATGGRLRLPRPRRSRLRPHRPRREGPRRAGAARRLRLSPSAASTAPGETVYRDRAPARRQGRRGPGLPLTLVAERPTASNTGAPRRGPGPGRRAASRLPLLSGARAARGGSPPMPTRRARPSARRASSSRTMCRSGWRSTLTPEAPACGAASRPRSTSPPATSTARRARARRVRRGRGPGRRTHGIKGLDGYTVGLEDETVEASTAEIEEHGTTDAKAAPPCRCRSRT